MELLLGWSLTTWLVGAIIAVIIYKWVNFAVNHYWKSKNVPCDNPAFSFGLVKAILSGKTLFEMDEAMYKKHGRICGAYFGYAPMLMVSDPELLRKIFVKDFQIFPDRRTISSDEVFGKMMSNLEGEDWKRIRSIVSPVFTSGKMRKLAILINRSAEAVTESLLKSADGEMSNVELKRLCGAFTLDVIASTAFGTDLDSINNPDNIFVVNARKFFNLAFNWRLILLALAPGVMKALKIGIFDFNAMTFFSKLVLQIKEKRLKEGKGRDDFLQMLIDIESEKIEEHDTDNSHFGTEEVKVAAQPIKKKTLSTDELVAQCVLFFLAGYDTTATTISLVAYNLALNQDCQEKLLNEVDGTWEKHGKVDFDIVTGMKYLDAVISETLRMYPPAVRLERKCVEDYQLGDTGITIPKGMYVGVPLYAMHHDPEFYPDPEIFNPDRFLPENKDSIVPYTYLPFGAGQRNCVAMRFALMEVKLCLFHIFRRVSFQTCSETKVPLDYYNGTGLLQPKAVIVRAERRSQ